MAAWERRNTGKFISMMEDITEEEQKERQLQQEEEKILSGIVKKRGIKKVVLTLVNMEPPSQELGTLKKEIRQAFEKFEDDYNGK